MDRPNSKDSPNRWKDSNFDIVEAIWLARGGVVARARVEPDGSIRGYG